MTALEQYIRLEAPGRWRDGPDAPWREVLVSFGNASLVLSDFEERPLTHWALAAVEIVAREGASVVYAPDPQSAEVLEVTDAQMKEAIAAVSAMARSRASPQRRTRVLRYVLLGIVLGLVGLATIWGPELLRARAYALVSPEQAELMSDQLRPRLAPLCRNTEGMRVLDRLAERVAPDQRVEVRLWDAPPLSALPDGTLILSHDLVERAGNPGVVAGWIALGTAAGPALSPLYSWTQDLAARELLGFLSSGDVGVSGMRRMAAITRADSWQPGPDAIALATDRLAELGISPEAFQADLAARFGDMTFDPPTIETAGNVPPIIARDRDWLALQDICGG